ncbi:MAG: four helix bundle protein [Planctomycetota bacterium]
MQPFTELKVWQRSHALVLQIYRLTGKFPADERFGLTAQLRRAATSVPTNIAEGSRRQHRPDFARFLNIAEGSLGEVEYLVMLSRDLDYVEKEIARPLFDEANEIARMLYALRRKVESER